MYQRNRPWKGKPIPPSNVGVVSCFEPKEYTHKYITSPRGIALAWEYTKRFRPEHYYCSMMPGLPLWLFWHWQRMGVKTTGIVFKGQSRDYPDLANYLREAWELTDHKQIVGSAQVRDEACREGGEPITIEHVLHGIAPDGRKRKGNLTLVTEQEDSTDDRSGEADDLAEGSVSTDHQEPRQD